ncbi:MAG: amino acid adenylation domain-containing protein, partial [Chloroflexi bacterium]
EASHACDLETGPLLRVRLLQVHTHEQVLLLTLHHIVSDGWSQEVLTRELMQFYRAQVTGQPAALSPLPIQYADYALWQRGWLQGEVLETQLSYWRKQLADLQALSLPTDHPRPAVVSSRGAMQSMRISQEVSQGLQRLCQQEHVTLFMGLLSAFAVLLARYSGQVDIAVGTPVANRNVAEIEGLIGLFVNTLVIRTDLADDPTFVQLLRTVSEVCLSAYAHQDIPFEKVVEALSPERNMSRTPLFQVMLVLQNTALQREMAINQELADAPLVPLITTLKVESVTSKYDLTLSITRTEQGLYCALEYSTDLFEAETITRLLANFQTLLQGIVDNPQAHIFDLPLLSSAQREQLLLQWNATQTDFAQDVCVHQLFEQQVERTPDAVALVFEQQQLSYQQLNGQANQLARRLLKEGVGPDVLVGVCMERSLEAVVALLAVLKAGGAYVPLDPAYPQERLAYLLSDTQVSVVLTLTQLCNAMEQAHRLLPNVKLIVLESALCISERACKDNPASTTQSDHLAYTIYTSGSTGKPKGAMNTHRGICNRLLWMQDTYQLSQQDRVLHKTPFGFDVSVWELLWPLLAGARLIVARPGGHQDPSYLRTLITQQQVTTLHFVPSMLQAFLAESNLQNGTSLRQVMCSGEALSPELQACFLREVGEEVQLHNLYGPTEAAIDVTFWQCQRESDGGSVPIGRPIANTQTYVLDSKLEIVPVGVVGELYLGGVGLGRGYWKQPELTAGRFIANPFAGKGQEPGTRLYRTGDLARYRPDGAIEYLGRMDHQVKLRGLRIELGEIEATLRAYPGVQEAVVVLREEDEVRKYLVAYVVTSPLAPVGQAHRLLTEQIHEHLCKRLPDYMVPASILLLERLPLMPNGKVDRKALPIVDLVHRHHNERTVAPSTPLQELLGQIWQDVLGLSHVGIHDNFFELGGHSLLAIQLLSRVRGRVGVEVALRAVFEEPTISGLALLVEQALREGVGLSIPPLVAMPRPETIPLSFAQERLWFLDQLQPGSAAYLMPGAYRLRERMADGESLDHSLQQLMQRHENLRTTFGQREGQPRQVIHEVSGSGLIVIDLQGLGAEQAEQQAIVLARQEASHACDLETGPLLRVRLLQVHTHEQVLLLTLHHIVSDGWSQEVLTRELMQFYRAQVTGQPAALSPLPIQYADYALWQREWLQGEVLETQLSYWRKQLADLQALSLPTDHPRPAVISSQGATQSVWIEQRVSQGLQRLCQQEHVTLFMALLSAFAVLLARYSGQVDIAVGTPVANRNVAEIEGLIGLFVNTLVIRTDLADNPTFVQLLRTVSEVCLSAYAHQDIPFEKVVEALSPERDMSRTPLFQVMLVLQNTLDKGKFPHTRDLAEGAETAHVPVIRPFSVESATSAFDLTLSLTQTEQGLYCALEYSTDLFEAETITRLLANFQTLLQSIVDRPQARLGDLPLLTEAEHRQLLIQWNATQTDFAQDVCVHQLFEQQVERTPEAIAAVLEESALSYGQLNRQANHLAWMLQGMGARPDVLVVVCMQRSLALVIALLAILKAGAAYVPLDPSMPAERLAWMLSDAQPAFVLTQAPLMATLPAMQAPTLALDADGQCISDEPALNPTSEVMPQHLAYVMYTSGSTGRPKGVMNTHQGICNTLLWVQKTYQLTQKDGLLQSTTFSFDPSLEEILWPLTTGARLVIPPAERSQESGYLVWLLAHAAITVLETVPAVLQVLLEEPGWPDCHDVRVVICGG